MNSQEASDLTTSLKFVPIQYHIESNINYTVYVKRQFSCVCCVLFYPADEILGVIPIFEELGYKVEKLRFKRLRISW